MAEQQTKDRALLEGQGKHTEVKLEQQSRERIIDIKMPTHFYTPKVPTQTATQSNMRRSFIGYDVTNVKPISSIMTSAVSSQYKSQEPSRILPISKLSQSPTKRRDMVSFSKAKQAESMLSLTKPSVSAKESTEKVIKEVSVIEGIQDTAKSTLSHPLTATVKTSDFTALSSAESESLKVVSPPKEINEKVVEKKECVEETLMKPDVQYQENESGDKKTETDQAEAKEKPDKTQLFSKEDTQEDNAIEGQKDFANKEKILDSTYVEEIFEKVIKPAGVDAKLSSPSDTKMTYHVEKTKEEDGSTTTQIILQTKVEEDVDLSEDSALDELLSQGVQQISLKDLEGTPAVSMIQNFIGLGSLENKSVKLEIIETTSLDPQTGDELKSVSEAFEEVNTKPYLQPSSTFFHIEEAENEPQPNEHKDSPNKAPCDATGETAHVQEVSEVESLQITDHNKSPDESSWFVRSGPVQVQEISRDEGLPYYFQGAETQEYFVSTPEENMSESEEVGGFISYGHYGVVDDLSDERYYQDENLLTSRRYSDERDGESPDSVKGQHLPECIIEEELHVSPTMQESMLEILKEESLGPREQLTGALEQLEGTVSEALQEELSFLTKASGDSDNITFNIKKVEQAQDNGTITYMAEVSVSQSLEESGMFEDETDYLSQDGLMAAIKSSSSGDYQALSPEAGSSYGIGVSTVEIKAEEMPGITSFDEAEDLSSASVSKTEKVIRLGPNERSVTFQMDINNSSLGSDIAGMDFQVQKCEEVNVQEFVQTQIDTPSSKIYSEKRIATVYLEKPDED